MSRRVRGHKTLNTLHAARELFSPKVTGTFLILVSVLTLLSLMSISRGQLTDAWIEILQRGLWGRHLGFPPSCWVPSACGL